MSSHIIHSVTATLILLSVLGCKQESNIKIGVSRGAGAPKVATKLSGVVYKTTSTTSLLDLKLSNPVSTTEKVADSVTVEIYSIVADNESPILLTSAKTDANGAYISNFNLESSSTILIVAQQNELAVGQVFAKTPDSEQAKTNSSVVADVTLKSTLTSSLLLKRNIGLVTLTSNDLKAATQYVEEQIAANQALDVATLVTYLMSMSSISSVLSDSGATEQRSSTFFDKLTAMILTNGLTKLTVTKLEQIQTSSSIAKDASTTFTVYATYSDNSRIDVTAKATWKSNDETVTKITNVNGSINATGVGAGTTSISVSFGGQTTQESFTVTSATLVSLVVTPSAASVTYGSTQQFVATGTFSDGSTSVISSSSTWTSSNTAVATIVAGTGLATPTGVGSTTITASKNSIFASTTMNVAAQAAPPNPTGPGSTANSSVQITVTWASGGGTTASYKIAYQTGSTPADCNSGTITTSSVASKSITGLTPNTQYYFRICALNGNGTPDVSSGVVTNVTTLQAAPPDPTVSLPGTTIDSSTQITVAWTSGGGSTASFKIAYQTGSTAPASCSTGTVVTSASSPKAITGLTAATQYAFRVCALNSNATPDMSAGVETIPTSTSGPLISGFTFVDGNDATNGLNRITARGTADTSLITFNSLLYSAWMEVNSLTGIQQFRVAVYNGNDLTPGWSFVDGGGLAGISAGYGDVSTPVLAVFNSKLYAIWSEVGRIRFAVYDGTSTWNILDGGGANGINKVAAGAYNPQLKVFNSNLYATWGEFNEIRVAVYNGNDSSPSWAFIDGVVACDCINYNSGSIASRPQLTAFNSKLYATWAEQNSTIDQIRIAVYNGNDLSPSWTFVDGNAVTGINKNTGQYADYSQLTVFNSKLYITWSEYNVPGQYQARMAVYNGNDGTPTWTFIDGNGTDGINRVATNDATFPQLIVFNSTLYSTWKEGVGGGSPTGQIRVVAYNGNDSTPSWSFVDGNGVATGINRDSSNVANTPQFTIFNSKLYFTWIERLGTANPQTRVAVAN